MKNWKQSIIVFLGIIVLIFTITVCDNSDGNDTTHTHQWGAWKSNTTQHWKECNCGEEYGRANHTYSGNTCSVCDYVNNSGSHTCVFSTTTWEKNDTHHWRPCTADNTCTIKGSEALHSGKPCICGYNEGGNTETGNLPDAWFQEIGSPATAYNIINGGTPPNEVIIPSVYNGLPVTNISNNAFNNCTNLTSIIIPNSVHNINGDAFSGCINLISITVISGINTYYQSNGGILYNHEKLVAYPSATGEVTIPNNVTIIGRSAFNKCTNLISIIMNNNVISIEGSAFFDCTNLTNVTFGNNVESIGSSAFYRCINLTNVIIPNSVNSIEIGAFQNCTGLISVTFNGIITEGSFDSRYTFPGDLRAKYLVGGIGTYTRTAGSDTWTK